MYCCHCCFCCCLVLLFTFSQLIGYDDVVGFFFFSSFVRLSTLSLTKFMVCSLAGYFIELSIVIAHTKAIQCTCGNVIFVFEFQCRFVQLRLTEFWCDDTATDTADAGVDNDSDALSSFVCSHQKKKTLEHKIKQTKCISICHVHSMVLYLHKKPVKIYFQHISSIFYIFSFELVASLDAHFNILWRKTSTPTASIFALHRKICMHTCLNSSLAKQFRSNENRTVSLFIQ